MTNSPADMVDLSFDLKGSMLPGGYPFALWDELVRILPWLAEEETAGVLPLRGAENGEQILLARRCKLVLRLPEHKAEQAMALSGMTMRLDDNVLAIGAGTKRDLQPFSTLHAPLLEGGEDEQAFMEQVGLQLQELGVSCQLICGKRSTIRSGEQSLSGYSLVLHELAPEGSLRVQSAGLGNKQRYGCGIFLPYKTISGLE